MGQSTTCTFSLGEQNTLKKLKLLLIIMQSGNYKDKGNILGSVQKLKFYHAYITGKDDGVYLLKEYNYLLCTVNVRGP